MKNNKIRPIGGILNYICRFERSKFPFYLVLVGVFTFLTIFQFPSLVFSASKLLQSSDVTYMGSFRVPTGQIGVSSFDYSKAIIAYNSANNSLFITSNVYVQAFAEINIPELKTGALDNLNTATVMQNFFDITEGHIGNIMTGGACCIANGTRIGGAVVYNNKIIGTSYSYYDTSNEAVLSHFISGLTLSASGDFAGMYQLTGAPTASFLSGYMCEIPREYQSVLGGTHLTGNGALSIISRTSYGPAAFSFNANNLGITVPLPVTPLMYYNTAYPSVGRWDPLGTSGRTPLAVSWNGTGMIRGIAFPDGTKSVLFIGLNGDGTFCYGTGGTSGGQCYDPLSVDKGQHAYPYHYKIWAYNVDDFISAKNGTKNPYDVIPYTTWELVSPYGVTGLEPGGAAYDKTNQRLYVAQLRTDSAFGYTSGPIINVYLVNVPKSPNTPRIIDVR